MLARPISMLILMIGVLGSSGIASAQERIHRYFNDASLEVKSTESPVLKREILSKRIDAMTQAIDMVQGSSVSSERDDVLLERMKTTLSERSDELHGANGFDPVPDHELDAYSSYIVQDMEQADQVISISLVTLLLIIIIIILIA
jgi:hypothetical protein